MQKLQPFVLQQQLSFKNAWWSKKENLRDENIDALKKLPNLGTFKIKKIWFRSSSVLIIL